MYGTLARFGGEQAVTGSDNVSGAALILVRRTRDGAQITKVGDLDSGPEPEALSDP